eukprot:gene3380-2501_t
MSAFATESSADPELQAENEDEYDEDEDYEEEEEIDTDWVFSSVKRPVDVYLSDEDRWVAATLVRITDSVDRLALVSYDDEDFDDETIPFEDLRPGQLPSKKRQKEKKAAEKRAASNAAAQANQAAAASAASQQSGAVNEIKFRRYLTDMIVNDQFVTASWQPTLEAATAPIIDKLIALLATFTAANANGPVEAQKVRADLQEFDRSLHQSRNQHDCFLYRNDTYLVQVPLHLPPIVYPAGTFVNKKEQEKQAASRRTQVRLGAFVLSTDGSKVLQFLDEDEYMQKMGTWAHASSDEFAKINLIEFANATGAMPLPVQEPHNQSNKSPVLIARILHAIDEWNANHSGEEVMDLFTIGGDPAGSESASEVGSTGSSSTTVSREDIVAQALQRECHRISTKFVFTATSTFHANGALTQLVDCYRTKLSFTGWQDALRRQHAHGGQEDGTGEKLRSDSVVSASSDQTGKSRSSSIVDATITAGGGGGGKSRSGSLAEPAVAPTNGNKSRSGSIVHEKDLNPPQHGTKSRSGSLADKDLRPPVTSGNKAHPVNTGGLKTVQEKDFKPNSRAARRAAAADDEDEEEPLKVDKVASVDDDGSPAAAKGKKSQPKKSGK